MQYIFALVISDLQEAILDRYDKFTAQKTEIVCSRNIHKSYMDGYIWDHQSISKLICQYIHKEKNAYWLQDSRISIANALQILKFCTKQSLYLNAEQSQMKSDEKQLHYYIKMM